MYRVVMKNRVREVETYDEALAVRRDWCRANRSLGRRWCDLNIRIKKA